MHVPEEDPDTAALLLAWHSLEQTSQHVRETIATKHGIGFSDLQGLVFISIHPGRPMKALQAFLGMRSGAITALVDRLERAHLLLREPDANDRRSIRLILTEQGAQITHQIGILYARALDPHVPSDARASLAQGIVNIDATLQQQASQPLRP